MQAFVGRSYQEYHTSSNGVFYQSGLILVVFAAAAGMAAAEDPVARKHLANVQLEVLGFMFPALAVRFPAPEPAGLLPSVMCHFALVFVGSLVALVVRERCAAAKSGTCPRF